MNNWKATLAVLTLGAVFMSASYTMLIPFLPMYLIEELGVAADEVSLWSGVVFSVTFLLSGLMAPVWGALADRTSSRKMAIRSAVFLSIAYFCGGLVQDVWQMLAMRAFQGFAAGLWPALLAVMSVQAPSERMGFSLGCLQAGMTTGGVLGPLLGGVLAEAVGMRCSFFVAGCGLAFVTLLLVFVVKDGPKPARKAKKSGDATGLLSRPAVRRMIAAACIVQMTILFAQPILPLYIAELNGSMDNVVLIAGIVFSVVGVSGIFASPMWGVAGQRYGYRSVLYVTLFLTGVFGVVQAIPHDLVWFTVWRFVGGVTFAGIFPAINAALAQNSAPDERGKVFSYSFAAQQFGSVIGPLLGGVTAASFGNQMTVGIAGALLFPVFVVLIVRRTRGPRPHEGTPLHME